MVFLWSKVMGDKVGAKRGGNKMEKGKGKKADREQKGK